MKPLPPPSTEKAWGQHGLMRATKALRTMNRSTVTTLLSLVRHRAQTDPNWRALLGCDEQLSYGQLTIRAECIAEWAWRQGVGHAPNRPVTTFTLLMSILAGLRRNLAWTPVMPAASALCSTLIFQARC